MAAIEVTTRDGSTLHIRVNRLTFLLIIFISRLLPGVQPATIYHVGKGIGFLALFLLAFPLTLIISCVTTVIHFVTRHPAALNPNGKRILISGGGMTKSLQLARSFHSAGHYVVLTEEYAFTAHRFSRCVARFYVCEDSDMPYEHIQSIVEIVKREQIDVFIPVSHSTTECLDALVKQALRPLNCHTFHGDIEQLAMLSDKYEFINKARSLGLTVPKSLKITHPSQVLNFDFSREKRQFILKPIVYNSFHRDHLTKLPRATREKTVDYVNSLLISEECPWIMQEFLRGKEYCTHGAVQNGQVRLYACCQSSHWLLNYKHLADKPHILRWVEDFCSATNLTGQASFDFIESDEDGLPYALECNPRTHTAITTFYNHSDVAEAYLSREPLIKSPVQPHASAREVYWLYHELWNLFQVRKTKDLMPVIRRLLTGKEAIYSIEDPLPFFLQYTVHIPVLLLYNLMSRRYFKKIDCNLGLLL